MIPPIGKFGAGVATRQINRWEFEVLEELAFNDPVHGLRIVPAGFVSNLASIRILREVCRWAALCAFAGWVLAWGWLAFALLLIAGVTLALYGMLAGYGMRAAMLHDWLYTTGALSRSKCDGVFYRALTTGDGTARWRAAVFWVGVRLGGSSSFLGLRCILTIQSKDSVR